MGAPWKLPSSWQEPIEVVSSEPEKSMRRVAVATWMIKVMRLMKRMLYLSKLADAVMKAREINAFG